MDTGDSKTFLVTNRNFLIDCITEIIDSLLNLFFPETCLICSAPVTRWRNRGVCTDCIRRAGDLKIFPPFCPSCGLPMPNFAPDSACLCGDCILSSPPFSGARSFGYYTGELGKLVRALKFHNRSNLAGLLAPLMVDTFLDSWDRNDFDMVIPIPLHPERRRHRGYNQAGLLARSLAHHVGIPLQTRILMRKRSTAPQTGLTDSQRAANVRDAFDCVEPERIAGRRILLIDDVMTTGATVASASETLVKSGALRVSVLTLARTEK